jgi:hypothetical protein
VIKTSFSSAHAAVPNFSVRVIEDLLESWIEILEPIYIDWLNIKDTTKQSFRKYCNNQSENIAILTLQISDTAIAGKYQSIVLIYNNLRPIAKDHIKVAVPKVAEIFDKYLIQ